MNVSKPEFVYTTYIAAPQEKVFEALTDSTFTKQYWGGTSIKSDWTIGAPVELLDPTGKYPTTGEVLAYDPPRLLSYTWLVAFHEVFSREGHSKVVFELETEGPWTKLTITHDGFEPDSLVYEAVSGGWPSLLCGLKTLLETGSVPESCDEGEMDPHEAVIQWGLAERAKRQQQ